MPDGRTMSAPDWGRLVALSVMWGGGYFFGQLVIAELPTLTSALGRVAFAAAALAVFVRLSGGSFPQGPRAWLAVGVLAVLANIVPFSLILWSQTHIPSGLASILNATTPLFAVLVAHVATDEKLTPARLAGIVVGLAGVAVMIGPNLLLNIGGEILAELAALGAALSYACSAIYARRFRGTSPVSLAATQLIISTCLLAPIVAAVDRPWEFAMPSTTTWIAIIGLSLLCTALPYVVYYRLLASAGPTNALLVTFLSPISAIILGMAILGERLEPRHFAGMLVIFAGLAVIDGRPARLLAAKVRAGVKG